jgi:excisionase family DNA binding protein
LCALAVCQSPYRSIVPAEFRSYTTIEVARRLGVSLQTVQRWVDAGRLKAWKTLGGHRRIDAESAEALFRTQSSDGGAEPASAANLHRILIVDDDPLDLELMVAFVRRTRPDSAIDLATDGFQALLRAGKAMPDILITDVNMPHMDGFEMIRALAEESAQSPSTLIAVSSLSPSDLASRGRLLPGVHFMSKPVDQERLAALLRDPASAAKA